MSRELRSWWSNWKQKRRRKLLSQRIEETEDKTRSLLIDEYAGSIDSPVTYAERILHIKPFSYQVKLLEDQSKRIVACMGRQTGKTTTIAMKTIYFADKNSNATVLITSPSLRQSMIMFDRISTFVFSTSHLHRKVARATRTLIQFSNGSCIIALPCSEHMLRGYTANMVVLDEASWIPETVITQILFPMLSTTDGYAIFLSTPWDRNHFFYRAFCNPKYSVHKVKSNECPLIKPEFLQEMQFNMTKDAYLMEYEAEFVDAFNSFFPKDLISSCVVLAQKLEHEFFSSIESPIQKGDYYGGVDFGKLQDYSVISVLKREEELLKLVYVYQFPLESSYSNVIGHLVHADQKFGFRNLVVDQTGVGEPVLEEIRNQGLRSVDGLKFTIQTKEDLLGRVKIMMEQNRLVIPYHRQLCQQINEQQYERTKSGHLQFTHPNNSHDDMLWSLALAVYASTQTPPPGKGAVILEH